MRHPHLEPVREELQRAKWIWAACCLSPIVYFFIARWVDQLWMDRSQRGGLLELDPQSVRVASRVFLFAMIGLEVALLGLKRWFDEQARRVEQDLFQAMKIYLKRTLVLLALSELPALGGLLFFLACGNMRAVFIGGVAAYLFYAQSYPSEEGLARLTKRTV